MVSARVACEVVLMSTDTIVSTVTASTQLLRVGADTYAYRRFGGGDRPPLLCLQHFTGTLDNWDPAVIDPLAQRREVILFDNAGIGRSSGNVPTTIAGMAKHAFAFLDSLGLTNLDVLGFSLGGMVALQMVRERPSIFRRMILAGTAPRGGEDIMHLEKPSLAKFLQDPTLRGYAVLHKIFFPPTKSSLAAGQEFIERLAQRKEDRDPRQDRRSPRRNLQHFVNGNSSPASASPTCAKSASLRSSSTASMTK
jgi:pimeloyl-ACP methyl ester carboxylesterase